MTYKSLADDVASMLAEDGIVNGNVQSLALTESAGKLSTRFIRKKTENGGSILISPDICDFELAYDPSRLMSGPMMA